MNKKKERLKVSICGLVQGVGFRPFIYNLAKKLGLNGSVINNNEGVFIEVEGEKHALNEFLLKIESEKPHLSHIQNVESIFLDPVGYKSFEIRKSDSKGERKALVLPDIATCSDCLNELFDESDRRYLYPFINCTNCGPRFSIIEKLPYDRFSTTMKNFQMCEKCLEEYKNPEDRRFHAQPNACEKCGPELKLFSPQKILLASKQKAVDETIAALKNGLIVALKGIGGYQILVDAKNDSAILNLRKRKERLHKPFAVMAPSLEDVQKECVVSELEKRLLLSSEAPIVLLTKLRKNAFNLASPNNPNLGVMLPYSPLHHILLKQFGSFLIVTSGNLSNEPICITENEAFLRLNGISDLFLTHNRGIERQVDDSIAQIVLEREIILRRSRGYAPFPIRTSFSSNNILAVGGHLKNNFSIALGNNVFTSQHIGDLDTKETLEAFDREIKSFSEIYNFSPTLIACDKHPEYESTKWAKKAKIPVIEISHHLSHIYSCMAENEISHPCLGVSWDGTGFGDDKTIWGGEFFLVQNKRVKRVAHIKPFRLPGGEKAVMEGKRVALSLLWSIYGENLAEMKDALRLINISDMERNNFIQIMKKNINSPLCTSLGRLFDAVSSILGLSHISYFEGQSAMALEFSIDNYKTDEYYGFELIKKEEKTIIYWGSIIKQIIYDKLKEIPVSKISSKFHNSLAEIIVSIAKETDEEKVVLSGGCFQNKYLIEKSVLRLKEEKFKPYWHKNVPPNDGGISLGQVYGAFLQS